MKRLAFSELVEQVMKSTAEIAHFTHYVQQKLSVDNR